MDTLSTKVGQLHCENNTKRAGRSRCRTPRLPTPETSTGSVDESDCSKYYPLSDMSIHSHHSRADSTQRDAFFHKQPSDPRGTMARTPPYLTTDQQRPSLPSLKFILGDELASPPRTPTFPAAASQPAPCEPACRPDAYRPASLYPNKKQKIETQDTSVFLSNERLPAKPTNGFAFSPIRSHAPRLPTHASARPRSPPFSGPLQTGATRGASEPGPSTFPSMYVPPRPAASSSLDQPSSSYPPRDHQLPAPHSTSSERSWNGSLSRTDTNGTRSSQPDRSPYSVDGSDGRTFPSRVEPSHVPPPMNYAYPQPPSHRPPESFYPDRRHSRDYGYPSDQRLDTFVQAPYEYDYPKTRKRSNLPKQSTEIMRAWFDQNIENPYPSEEQKAVFANATGISMTQVSNWFINHRRRCPELRDRRAERRKG